MGSLELYVAAADVAAAEWQRHRQRHFHSSHSQCGSPEMLRLTTPEQNEAVVGRRVLFTCSKQIRNATTMQIYYLDAFLCVTFVQASKGFAFDYG